MEYLTYPQYQAMGGQLSMSEFTPLEYACRKRIDLLTDCRVQPMADAGAVPEAVRMCMFALINLESKVGVTAQVDNPVATSFNTDGYSESYGNLPKVGEAKQQMDAMVGQYLYGEVDLHGVPLLFRGVRP